MVELLITGLLSNPYMDLYTLTSHSLWQVVYHHLVARIYMQMHLSHWIFIAIESQTVA